jgi:hypothetical protein
LVITKDWSWADESPNDKIETSELLEIFEFFKSKIEENK